MALTSHNAQVIEYLRSSRRFSIHRSLALPWEHDDAVSELRDAGCLPYVLSQKLAAKTDVQISKKVGGLLGSLDKKDCILH